MHFTSPLPSPLEAVIFDMDGLLLDTEALYKQTIFAACAELGYAMTDELLLSMVGSPNEVSDAKLVFHFGAAFPLPDYHSINRSHFARLSSGGIPLRPGAVEILTFLKASGIPRAVATSTDGESAHEHLRQSGLHPLLDSIVTRTDVTRGKPHPETFLKAAHSLGANPANCLALEDSHNGVRAAAAAGMATIMVPDLLLPTEEIRALCIGVADSLSHVLAELAR